MDAVSNLPPIGFDAVAYINEPRWRQMSLGLDRVTSLMRKLGDPQLAFKSVHVAGTNGKGSVCAYLDSILRESGYEVGLFTSPYIKRFEERICVGGEMILPDDLTRIAWKVKGAAEAVAEETGEHPTEFELMFACAALHFAECGCDVAVIECGLGGRLDATNCIIPELSITTPISLDHVSILGDTIEKIALEKAGIIKPHVPVLSASQAPAAMEVISAACKELDARLYALDASKIANMGIDPTTMLRRFSFDGVEYETGLLGSYQPSNACLAIRAAQIIREQGFDKISPSSISKGIFNARWPGRFEIHDLVDAPLVVIDGAHNADGAMSFAKSLGELLAATGKAWHDVIAVCGVLEDKDRESIIGPMIPNVTSWVTYTPDNPRALDASKLAQAIRALGAVAESAMDGESAMRIAIDKAGPKGVVAAFGSLYGISSVERGL